MGVTSGNRWWEIGLVCGGARGRVGSRRLTLKDESGKNTINLQS